MRLIQRNQRSRKQAGLRLRMCAAYPQRAHSQRFIVQFTAIFIAIVCVACFTAQPVAASRLAQAQGPTYTVPADTPVSTVTSTTQLTDLVTTTVSISASTPTQNRAPSTVKWSVPVVLSTPGMYADAPAVATDSEGIVHVLWGERDPSAHGSAEAESLLYARFDGKNWTQPQDVLTSLDQGGAESPEMVYTPDGFLHAIWGSGGEDSRMMYARAPACCAEKASNWSKPIVLGLPVNLVSAFAVDKQGRLHAAFASTESGNISYYRSDDSGTSWNVRHEIQGKVRVGDEYPSFPTLAVDGSDHVYLAWTILPWPGVFALYARSDDGGDTWTEPQIIDRADSNEFAGKGYGPIYIAVYCTTSPEGVDRVHLLWDGSPTVERNYMYSDDGGKNWSPRYRLFPEITLAGRARFNTLMMDSAGTLHATAFNLHSVWLGSSWLPVSEQMFPSPDRGAEQQSSAVSLGNQLNLVWQDKYNDAGHPATVSFVYGLTSAPRSAPQPVPEVSREKLLTQPVPPGVEPESPFAPTKTPPRVLPTPTVPAINPDPSSGTRNPMEASLLGVAPIFLIFAVVFIFTVGRSRFRPR